MSNMEEQTNLLENKAIVIEFIEGGGLRKSILENKEEEAGIPAQQIKRLGTRSGKSNHKEYIIDTSKRQLELRISESIPRRISEI